MTDLTEQWKKCELDAGWYYVKGSDGLFCMMSDYALYRVNLEHPDNTISLLAPVPSYKEWQKMKEQRDACAWALDKIGDVLVNHKLVKKIDEVLK